MPNHIPGFTGFEYARFSSQNRKAMGKFTTSNDLCSLQNIAPTNYDKTIISIYTQSSLIHNELMDAVNQATPFYVNGSEAWQWDVEVPCQSTKIVDVPATTLSQSKPGIDGMPFQFVLDVKEYTQGETIVIGNRIHGPQVAVIQDPVPQGKAWLYTVTLLSSHPQDDFIDKRWLAVGMETKGGTSYAGEFTQKLPGLGKFADKITMYESLSSAYGRSYRITKWADQVLVDGKAIPMTRDSAGRIEDMIAYVPQVRNSTKKVGPSSVRIEPYVEFLLRKKMISDKTHRFVWNKAGFVQENGSKQDEIKLSDGIIQRMRNHGNYLSYNRGEFSSNLLRTAFGDLFYGRVSMQDRHVQLYTNEAGLDVFQQAVKDDALNSGLTFTVPVPAISTSPINASSSSQKLTYGWAFNSTYTRETGTIEVVHLDALEDMQLNGEFGQNKKATPIFLIFNISNDGSNTFSGNIREVRPKGAPSMTWGYVDGRESHLGHHASQGMQSANMDPGYQIWFEDRSDVFIEDLSRTFLIEEKPQF